MTVNVEILFGFIGMIVALLSVGVWIVRAQSALFDKATRLIKEEVAVHSTNSQAHPDFRDLLKCQQSELVDFAKTQSQWNVALEDKFAKTIQEMKRELLAAIEARG